VGEIEETTMKSEWKDYRLCYVENGCAYFTDNFENQWGDDWNDAPYEHNAGLPYTGDNLKADGDIVRVPFAGMTEPCKDHLNSPLSVQDINSGSAPWLRSMPRLDGEEVEIYAGETLDEVIGKMALANAAIGSVKHGRPY
jgi:hypothetical protein